MGISLEIFMDSFRIKKIGLIGMILKKPHDIFLMMPVPLGTHF